MPCGVEVGPAAVVERELHHHPDDQDEEEDREPQHDRVHPVMGVGVIGGRGDEPEIVPIVDGSGLIRGKKQKGGEVHEVTTGWPPPRRGRNCVPRAMATQAIVRMPPLRINFMTDTEYPA